MADIAVVGSLNVDISVNVARFLQPGETMTGTKFSVFTGGKGGNQAVAAARLGAKVAMVGCVGGDANGRMYLDTLRSEGIAPDAVRSIDDETTGVAVITIDGAGENTIVVVPGANAGLSVDVVTENRALIEGAKVCMFQLEAPLVSIQHAAALAHGSGATVILDPAPAPQKPLSQALVMLCDYITPNETELQLLTGLPVASLEQAATAASALIRQGAKAVINKRGAAGALLVTRDGYRLYPGYRVNAVDTTAAGDTFNAGLAVGLSMGLETGDAIRLANAAAAISITALGAQGAMPSFEQATALIDGLMECR
jgi:ribokinase